MTSKQYSFLAFLSVVAGLVGGSVSNHFFTGGPAYAQKAGNEERTFSAERFDVVDKEGNVRATLGLSPQGEPVLSMFDQEANTRFSIFSESGGTQGIVLFDKEERLKIGLSTGPGGTPSLNIYDGGGSSRITLSLADDGQPSIRFYDEGNIIRTAFGSSNLILYDEVASAKVGLSASAQGGQGLVFLNDDKNGKVGLALFNSKDGEASLSLNDKNGWPRAVIGATSLETGRTGIVEKRPTASVVLFDKDNKVMWKAP